MQPYCYAKKGNGTWSRCAALLMLACLPVAGLAHDLSVEECVEGSDFIGNAAKARDSGVSKSAFIDQVQSDIVTIQSYPPPLRWFVQDDDDAKLLVEGATQVFDEPQEPDAHRNRFLVACLDHTTSQKQQQPQSVPWIPNKLPPRIT